MRRQGGLRSLHRDRDGNLVAEALGQANAVLAGENETHVIRRVNGLGPGIVGSAEVIVRGNSLAILGHQAPFLAAEETPAITKLGLPPRLAETESVAVGLSGGGGDAGREEVGGYVAGKTHVFQAAIDEAGDLRLAG